LIRIADQILRFTLLIQRYDSQNKSTRRWLHQIASIRHGFLGNG
jgi:hypothetical protein